ncbi:transporter [Methylobacterium sp. J-068]|uniref:transporter n=1 Tax=Methylobacterium sp. J-068 TaxID=2836649 RepID=UPI001FB8AC57|nr:transporter [Methylobacterium sp. J-068]MCJ2033967.1 transporter [Methylobacterium sp. J-068]
MRHLYKAVFAATLSACAVSAHAASVSQPGETVGIAAGAPAPDGVYFIDTFNFGRRSATGGATDVGVNIPVLFWATPARLFGAHVGLLVAIPELWVSPTGGRTQSGFTDPWLASVFAWDIGNGLGFSYMPAVYIPSGTNLDRQTTTFNQRFGLSYTANGYNLTANLLHGIIAGPQFANGTHYTDYLNLDLTATKKFGKWEFGPVAYASTDLPTNFAGYKSQRQIAVGGLVGYAFDKFTLQAYVTRDVAQQNYGGADTRGWMRIIAPLYSDAPAVAPAPLLTKR